MALLNSKKLKDLQTENEELNSTLQRINDKEDKLIRLEEVIKTVYSEISELNRQKADYITSVDQLKSKETELNDELEKLHFEIDKLREMKSDEQHNLLFITNHINAVKPSTDYPNKSTNNQIEINDDELQAAEKRKKVLETENAKLEIQLGELGGIIGALDEQQADLQALIEEKKLELKNLDDSVSDNKRQELIKLDEKISSLKENETKTVNEFEKRIGELSLKEKSLRDSINLKNKELEEIENNIQKKGSHQTSTNEDNLISLIVEEQNLADSITKKRHYLEEMEMKISSLKDDEQMLKASVEAGKKELGEIGSINGNSINLQNSISLLKEEEGELRGKLDLLNQAEQIKKELISELNDKLSANEINFAALEKDYEEKTNQLEKTTLKLRKITGESTYKQKELLTLAQVVDDKTKTLKNLAAEISFSEGKINSLKKETIKIENLQTEAEQKYESEKEIINALKKDYMKLKEYLPSLERRKTEMKEGNSMLESRFKNMFQVYNKELNEANKKKNVLEQIIVKKEKDINERDQVLFEKVAALNETESVLKLRQVEIGSFEDLLSVINEQTELLKNDLINLDDKAAAKKNANKELDLEAELLKEKINEFEKGLHALLENSKIRYLKGSEKRVLLEKEIKEYEHRLTDLNYKIKESMNELVGLQESLGRIKIEHEEHRSDISKLVSMKKKMQEEVDKNQVLLEKYTKIKEKLKAEQEAIKKRRGHTTDREFAPARTSENFQNEKDFSKIFRL
jgi:chromosome segregation protein